MKKQLLSFKILFVAPVAIMLFVFNTAFATVTVTITAPTNITIAPGGTFTITATATTDNRYFFNLIPAVISNVSFYSNTGALIQSAINSPYSSGTITAPITTGVYTYTVIATDNLGYTSTTANFIVTVTSPGPPAPTVSSSGSVCGSGTVTFNASDTGPAGDTYTFYSDAAGTNALLTGTSNTYTTPTITSTTTYYVSYTSGGLKSSLTAVTATVIALPTLTTQPVNKTVCNGSSATFSVTASGTGLIYQWQANGVNLPADGTDGNGTYSGTQTATLTITPNGSFYNGAVINCIISNASCNVTSNPAILTIVPLSATFTLSSTSAGIGNTVTIAYAGSDPATDTYTWNFNGGTPATGTTQGPFAVQWATAGTKTITLTVKNASGCTTSTTQTVQVISALTGYAFSKPLTLNTSATGINSTLSNFPALIYIQDNALKVSTTCNNHVQFPNGNYGGNPVGSDYDFAFTIAGSPELNYQVENYDQVNGILLVWVQIPSMTKVNTDLDFYFGSLSPAHGLSFTQATWASDYKAVYHFDETSGNTAIDATNNNNAGTIVNAISTFGEARNAAGLTTLGAYIFNGISSKITVPGGVAVGNGAFTLSAWINLSATGQDQKIMTNQTASVGGYKLGVYSNNIPESETTGVVNRGVGTIAPAIGTGAWHYVQSVFTGTQLSTYVDGKQYQKDNTNNGSPLTNPFYIGVGEGGNSLWFFGNISEARVSKIGKTNDWIKAEYYNQSNPIAFTDYSGAVATYQTTAASIPGVLTYTWTGVTSTDPSDASNWNNTTSGVTGQAPVSGTSTLVIPVSAKYPTLTSDLSVYGLTLTGSANITLNGHMLNVACNIYNQSTGNVYWNNNDASGITWNGTSAQSYNGNTGTSGYAHIGTMVVNNSSGATVTINSDSLDIYHELTITKGNLAVSPGGFMALKSIQSETANVDAIPSGYSISGNVNIERYFPGGAGYRSYRLITIPANTATSVLNQSTTEGYIDLHSLNTGLMTAGPGSGFGMVNMNPLSYLYDESRAQNYTAYVAGKNVGIYSWAGSAAIGATPAYSVMTYGTTLGAPKTTAQVPVGNSIQLYYVGAYNAGNLTIPNPGSSTSVVTGYLNQGTIPIYIYNHSNNYLSYTSGGNNTATPTLVGLNQVGNPYASTLDLDNVYVDNKGSSPYTNISPIFWELKQPTNTFVAYNASSHAASVSGSGASAYVASGQGFYVQALSSTSTLTFFEQEKVNVQLTGSTSPALILSQKVRSDNQTEASNLTTSYAEQLPSGLAGFHLRITKDTLTYTETGLFFNSAWSDKFLGSEDALDLDGPAPKVYLSSYSSDGTRLCINQLGDYSKGKTVKLYASATTSGTYKISLADINNMDALYNVYLRDHKLGDSVNLRNTNVYTFTINTADTTTYGANRFDLMLEREALPPYQLLTFTGQKVSSGVQLNWIANGTGNYTGFILEKEGVNNNFSPIYTVQSNNNNNFNFVDSNPVIGNNVYRLAQNDVNGNVSYSSLITIGYNNVTSNGYFSIYPNPSKDMINVLVNSTTATAANYTADIYNTSGTLMDHRALNTYSWTEDISSYKEGVYIIALKNTNGDVLAKSKFIKTK
ncbi:MAG: LamG-like jellyroll fold domain-containing protein [Sphingobacteriales bacterium]